MVMRLMEFCVLLKKYLLLDLLYYGILINIYRGSIGRGGRRGRNKREREIFRWKRKLLRKVAKGISMRKIRVKKGIRNIIDY